MNQTTNYNFNVPIGSDIVNPLVQDFPNWESLDSILRNVANTGITTATHTKTGTIHTLTFSETSVPMIRFQATADFNTNDTFTVNGVSVSALTVAGSALPDGAFVIGSMVLCELRDNLLTVYSSGSDASTLEGHPASYFATASDLNTVDNKTDANKTLIDQIDNDFDLTKHQLLFSKQYTTTSLTWSQCFLDFITSLANTDIFTKYDIHTLNNLKLRVNNTIYQLSFVPSSNSLIFYRNIGNATSLIIQNIEMSTTPHFYYDTLTATGILISDIVGNQIGSGQTFTLFI